MAFSDEGLHNFATFSLILKIFEEKSLKPPWIFLQIWLRHQRKTIIIFKDEKPASKMEICVVVVCLTFKSKKTMPTFSSFQILLFLCLRDFEDQTISLLNKSGNKRDQKSMKKSFISNIRVFGNLRTRP